MANRIREYRKRAGLKIEDLASRIGMSQGNLSKLELGQIAYTQYHLESVARELGCQPSDLIADGKRSPEALDKGLLRTVLIEVLSRVQELGKPMEAATLADIVAHVYTEAAKTADADRSTEVHARADMLVSYEARRA